MDDECDGEDYWLWLFAFLGIFWCFKVAVTNINDGVVAHVAVLVWFPRTALFSMMIYWHGIRHPSNIVLPIALSTRLLLWWAQFRRALLWLLLLRISPRFKKITLVLFKMLSTWITISIVHDSRCGRALQLHTSIVYVPWYTFIRARS